MSDLWRFAAERASEFDKGALDYDKYRPQYPDSVFDDIAGLAGLTAGDAVIEIGAGTGIATEQFVARGFTVAATEPAAGMLAVAAAKFGDTVDLVCGRFEDAPLQGPVSLVAAFNAWHWVEPYAGVERVAELLAAGGALALVWTEVVAWGQDPFEVLLADTFGAAWPHRLDHIVGSMERIRADGRFGEVEVRRHRFERTMDAATFIAVTRTYGGPHSNDRDQALSKLINDELGGQVTKVEDAVLYFYRRTASLST